MKSIFFIMLAFMAAGFLPMPSAHATITYTGDATSTRVGNSANGSLAIDGGSTLSSGTAYVGYNAGVTGTVAVDGAESKWAGSSYIYLGYRGIGTLNITNGGTVTGTTTYLGYNAGSSGIATIDGPGSNWTGSSTRYVGYNAAGTLNITNGGAVSNTNGYIGYNAGSAGTVTVDGFGSVWTNNGNLIVGNSGTGTLNIRNDGLVSATGTTSVGTLGTINFNGGTLTTPVLSGPSARVTGTGTINTQEWAGLSNVDLLFDATHGLTQTLTLSDAARNLTINYDLSGATLRNIYGRTLTINDGFSLTASTLYIAPSQISGTGTVNASGIVADMDLVFDASRGPSQSFAVNGATLNLNQSSSGALGVGHLGTGTLTIKDGVNVASNTGYLGNNAGARGTATVTGTGSKWTSSGALYVGNSGTGNLNVTDGGTVSSAGYLYIGNAGIGALNINNGGVVTNTTGYMGYNAGSSGTATVVGPGSMWTNSSTLYVGRSGTGTLNITNGGAVSNNTGYIGYNAGSTGAATVTGSGSTWTVGHDFSVGENGTGVLSISNGGVVSSGHIRIGYNPGSTGTVTVDGQGSKLVTSESVQPGAVGGTGTLRITNGGYVSSPIGYIGNFAGSVGKVSVNGVGSTWADSGTLYVGREGTGNLSISSGGSVSASTVSVNGSSAVTTDVGKGSSLTVGTGGITNNGTIRLVANAGVGAGTYTPITNAGTWTNTGTIQALGGIWNDSTHTMTVSDAALAFAGRATNIDLASAQRMLFVDPATAQVAGMSFLGATTSTPITVSASVMSAATLSALRGILASDQRVLSGWNFSTTGYAAGSPVYLSLYAGPGQDLSTLNIWHYDGSTWSAFTANDLAYDRTYASFTVTGFSGYAVSGAPVPIPPGLWLLGSGLAGLVGMRRRLFRK